MQRIQCIQRLHNCDILYCVTLLYLPLTPPRGHATSVDPPRHFRRPKGGGPLLGIKTYKNLWKIDDLGFLGLLGVQEGEKTGQDGLQTGEDGPKTAQDGPKRAHEAPKKVQDGPKRTPESASGGQKSLIFL